MSTSIRQRQSQSQTPGPAKGPDGRHIRLASLKNQRQSTPYRHEVSSIIRLPGESSRPQCPNKECPQSRVQEDDGKLVCMNCGYILQESQITQELTFGEASNGAAIVQGAFVGESDTTARNPAMAGNRMGGGMSSREQTERNGSHFMNSLLTALRLQSIDKERGMKYFKLASGMNFIQGRITRHVAAVCLYLACRGDSVGCKVMLIDFADVLEVNVFKLGQIYNELVGALHLQGSNVRGNLYECNPENLIQRFAQDMDFGPMEHKISVEAVGILKRMRRDWIYTGRRPAGVCGAALILAARMNNFRRTVREVVYTAKVADVTIHKRLDEFKYTESSKLTINEFRTFANTIETEHDPPSYYMQFHPKKKKKKNAKRKRSDTDIDGEEELEIDSARASEEPEPAAGSIQPISRRQDNTGTMLPPAIPIDPRLQARRDSQDSSSTGDGDSSDEEEIPDDIASMLDGLPADILPPKRRAGRPKGSKNKPLPEKTAGAIADEAEIEADMEAALKDPDMNRIAQEYHQTLMPTPPPTQLQPGSEVVTPPAAVSRGTIDFDSVIIYEHEFEDDPEVRDCLLSANDSALKEAVWVTNNGTWLLKKQAKAIKKELEEKSGTGKQPRRRKRRRGRMGDMSVYETINEDGEVSRPTTAAEATRMMLEKRGYSKRINYDAIISRAYDRSPSEQSGQSGSPASEPATFLLSGPRRTAERAATTNASPTSAKTKRVRRPKLRTKVSHAAIEDPAPPLPAAAQFTQGTTRRDTSRGMSSEQAESAIPEKANAAASQSTMDVDNEADDDDADDAQGHNANASHDEGNNDGENWKEKAGFIDEEDDIGSGDEIY